MDTTTASVRVDHLPGDRDPMPESEIRQLIPMYPAGLRIERRTVDQAQASYWLAVANTKNRPVNRQWVKQLSEDLKAGRWKSTHQGIAFDTRGLLVDGQHRLLAIRETGVAVELTITYGLDPDVMGEVDQTYRRTAGQTLAAERVKQGKRVGALARTILVCTLKRPVSHTEVIQFAHAHIVTLQSYASLADKYSAAVAAAFAHADIEKWQHIGPAAARLSELKWSGDGDPMRALARALQGMGGKTGARSMQTRFFTTLNALRAVHERRELKQAKALDRASLN